MASHPRTHLTPEQYLEIERTAEHKSEYYNGEMFAMSAGTLTHSRLTRNLIVALERQLRACPSEPVGSDMRVHIPVTGLYTYPDVSVFCGTPVFLGDSRDTLLNPTLIAEVLSPSTDA